MEKSKSKKIYYHKIKRKIKNVYLNFNLNGFFFINKKSKKRRIMLFEKYYKNTFKDLYFLKKFYFSKFKTFSKKNKRVLSIFFFNNFTKKLYEYLPHNNTTDNKICKNNEKLLNIKPFSYLFFSNIDKKNYLKKKINNNKIRQIKKANIFLYNAKYFQTNKMSNMKSKFEKFFFFKTKFFFKFYLKYYKKIKKIKKFDPNFRYKLLKWKIKQHMRQWKKKKYNIKKRKKIKLQYRFFSDNTNKNIFLKKVLNKKIKSYLYEQKKIYTNLVLNCFYSNTKKKSLLKIVKKNKNGKDLQRFLESKLNIILLRTGFFKTKDEINLIIKLGFILVNKQKITNFNYILKHGDIIQFNKKIQKQIIEKLLYNFSNDYILVNIPYYLTFSLKTFSLIYNNKKKKNKFKNVFFFSNFINYESLCFFNKNRSMPS